MLTRRAILQECLLLSSLMIASGLFAATIPAAFQEREHATPQLASETSQSPASSRPLILQEGA